ncbi:MAG: 3-oxoacyl-ACP reductase, partial [Acidimicrobiia bacterium]
EVLAGAGATVVCADVNGDAAETVAAAITSAGGHAEARPVDVSRRADVDELIRATASSHGRLDVMCNIAGIMHTSLVLETAEEDLDRVLAVNLKGVFFGCQAAGRVMAEQRSGSIVNMASGAIDAATAGIACYAIAKAGVNQLTKTLAVELGPRGVRVNAVAPGYVVTAMTGRNFMRPDGTIDPERFEAAAGPMRRRSPLGLVGEPLDIAMAVLYLASDASRFVTGQTLRPNGGVAITW